MRIRSVVIVGVALGLAFECVSGTFMLTSLLMALKGGMFASKVGMGGIIAMMMAASRNQQGGSTSTFKSNTFSSSLGTSNTLQNLLKSVQSAQAQKRRSRRRTREIDAKLIPELPSLLNANVRTGSETEALSVEKLANQLNNVSSPLTQRVMRQAAILDQLSCLPKLICGMTTVNPTKSSSLLNDYAFLTKFLFERDDDQEDEDDDDEKEGRLDAVALKKSSNSTYNDGKAKKKKKKPSDSDEYQDSDEITVDDAEFEESLADDLKYEEMAEEELIKDDPTMLSYILADAGMRMKGYKKSPYLVDHSDLPGYAKGSHHASSNPHLNTYSAQAALNGAYSNGGYGKRRPSYPSPKGQSRFEFKIGKTKEKDDTKSLLGHFLPGFVYEKIRARPSTSSSTDDFASDPFFDGFRRRRQLEIMEKQPQRPLTPPELEFVQKKLKEIQESTSPLTKYQVAEETGRTFRNQRQCRMLFARCPYTSNEVLTMIQNVRKLLNAQAAVGDQTVTLKQTGSGTVQEDSLGTSLSSGSVLNVPLGAAGAKGVTQISHQLDNGDKVEIMLKIKQNDSKKKPSLFSSSTSDAMLLSHYNDKDLLEAHQNLLAMKRQFQALAKLHNATVALQFNNVSSIQIPASFLAAKDEAGYSFLKQTGNKYTINKYKVKNPFSESQTAPALDVYGHKIKAPATTAPDLQEDAGSSAENSKPADGSDENQSTSQEDPQASSEDKQSSEQKKTSKQPKTPAKKTSNKKKKNAEEEEDEEEDEEEEDEEEAEEDDQEDEEEESAEQNVPAEVPLEYLQSRGRSKAKIRLVPGKKRPAAPAATKSPPTAAPAPMAYKKAPAPTVFVSRITALKSRPPAPLPTKPSPYKLRRTKNKAKANRSQDSNGSTSSE